MPLYAVPSEEAHARRRRVLDSLDEVAKGRQARIDRATDAFVAIVDAQQHLAACEKVAGLSPVVLVEIRRLLSQMERRLQRQLLARDNGGEFPSKHPALPPDPLAFLAGR